MAPSTDHKPRGVELRAIPADISDEQRWAFVAVAVRAQIESAAAMTVVAVGLSTHVLFDRQVEVSRAGPPGMGVAL